MFISLFTFPMEKINIRMKLKVCSDESLLRAIVNLFRQEGLRGAFRGLSLGLWTTGVGFCLNGFVYENLNLAWKRA